MTVAFEHLHKRNARDMNKIQNKTKHDITKCDQKQKECKRQLGVVQNKFMSACAVDAGCQLPPKSKHGRAFQVANDRNICFLEFVF